MKELIDRELVPFIAKMVAVWITSTLDIGIVVGIGWLSCDRCKSVDYHVMELNICYFLFSRTYLKAKKPKKIEDITEKDNP